MKYADIVFKNIEKSFLYKLNNKNARLGDRVICPFRNNKKMGYIIKLYDKKPNVDFNNIKSVSEILSPSITEDLFSLGKWISNYYYSFIGNVISSIYPPFTKANISKKYFKGDNFDNIDLRIKMSWKKKSYTKTEFKNEFNLNSLSIKKLVKENKILKKIETKSNIYSYKKYIKLTADESILDTISNKAYRQKEIITRLIHLGKKAPYEEFSEYYSSLKSLKNKGFINIFEVKKKQINIDDKNKNINLNKLTNKQNKIYKNIYKKFSKGFSVNYIYGITGSGKTEIYFHLIKDVINKGKQVIYLVPEVSLTTHLLARIKNAFGENVSLLHSYLRKKEKTYSWISLLNSNKNIAIGPRSAIFSPLDNLGLIIVDEEHESTYKQNNNPRYNGRDVAILRAKINNIPIVLGSATPSMESFYNVKNGKYNFYSLKERYKNAILPEIDIIDMRSDREYVDNFYPFSKSLIQNLRKRIKKEEQSIIFMNRKGYNTYVTCKKCGSVAECKNCSQTLTYYKKQNVLKCHICGKYYDFKSFVCKNCSSSDFSKHGIGTEKLNEKLEKILPESNIFRIDGSIIKKYSTLKEIFDKFKKGKIDILIGTQIIAKGIDFENVTFVGVVNADTMMNIPDFRANERTYQLISQVAGRAGRGDKRGEVLIQTYSPDSYVINKAVNHNYEGFYNKEIQFRKQLYYPPVSNLVRIIIENKSKPVLQKEEKKIESFFNSFKKIDNIQIIGPEDEFINKKKNYHRKFILIKGKNRKKIKKILKIFNKNIFNVLKSRINIDIDPYQMF